MEVLEKKMNKREERELLHRVTSLLLVARGHQKPEPDVYDIEWDAMEPDSQYTMCYEDVEVVFKSLEALGYTVSRTAPKMSLTPNPTVTTTGISFAS